MSLEKDVQEPGPDERCPQKKVATQRRVSFRPGDPIELPQVPSLPYLDQTPTDDGSDDETTDGPDKYRGRSRSEVAPTVIERFLVTRERKWSVTLASLVAAIPAFVLGLTLGYPSNALLDLTGDATELPPEFFFSTSSLSLFTALAPLGAIFGGPVGGWISDHWGRKCGLMFSGVPYLFGYLLLSYAHYSPTATVFNTLLFSGRALAGFGMGWASAASPVYTGEICSAKLRGIFVNFFPVFLTSGILFNYALGAIDDFRYYDTSLVALGIVALFEVLMFWLPETPRWLMSRGYVEDAEKVLVWLRGNKIGIDREMDDMKKSMSKKKTNVWKLFLKPRVFKPLFYILTLFFVQQMGGINGVTPFAGLILSNAGFSNPRTTAIYAVGVSGFLGLAVALVLVDVIGRKTPLIISEAGQFLATAMLGIHTYITRPSLCDFESSAMGPTEMATPDAIPCNPQFQYMALFSIILFAFSFTSGANSVPYVLLAELMPLPVRGKASGIAAAMTWGCAAFFTGFYFEFREWITPWFTLWAVAVIDILGLLFIVLLIPETKGKKLEQLENMFVKKPDTVETVL